MANSITPLPPVPLRSDTPENFVTKADAFLGSLNVFATECNAVGVALTLGATNATSITSLTVGAGSKSLTVETAKSYVPGMSVKIASTASPSNWMLGDVTSYTTGTGALVVNVTDASGSGTFTAWTTSQSSPGAITTSAQQAQLYTAFTTGGTSAAFTLTPVPAITSLVANQRFRVKFSLASTGTPTLAINGLTAANLQQYDATGALVTATLGLNQLTDVEYNGTVFVVLNPLLQTAGDARYAKLAGLSTQKFSVAAGSATNDAVNFGQAIALRTANVTSVPIASASTYTASHTLGVIPSFVQMEHVCLVAEQGYSVGDVFCNHGEWSGTATAPIGIWKSLTGMGVQCPAGYTIMLTHKTTSAGFTPTAANWAYRFSYR